MANINKVEYENLDSLAWKYKQLRDSKRPNKIKINDILYDIVSKELFIRVMYVRKSNWGIDLLKIQYLKDKHITVFNDVLNYLSTRKDIHFGGLDIRYLEHYMKGI